MHALTLFEAKVADAPPAANHLPAGGIVTPCAPYPLSRLRLQMN